MANDPRGTRSGGLGERLRALRAAHPTLAVLTELIQLDERRVTFRATVRIEGETRAQGHATQGADPEGTFVAAAEQLAVEQALLLGGFGGGEGEAATRTERAPDTVPMPPGARTPTANEAATPIAVGRRRATRQAARAAAPTRYGDEVGRPEPMLASKPLGMADDLVASVPPTSPPAGLVQGTAAGAPAVPASPATLPTDPATSTGNLADTAAITPVGSAGTPSPAPRRQRDRRAERARAGARQAAATRGPSSETDPGGPDESGLTFAGTAESATAAPTRAPLPVGEPERATLVPPARRTPPPPDTEVTHEAARAAWQVGRPIPAWWPPDRVVSGKRLPKAQIERLRALALDEEMTAAQLDSYSILLFGNGVAGLTQAQGILLEERLNPVYPSPLEELRVRRILHPIAVGDTVGIPADQPAFVRWRDIPPAEEAEPASAPAAPSWRAGGAKRGGNRRGR